MSSDPTNDSGQPDEGPDSSRADGREDSAAAPKKPAAGETRRSRRSDGPAPAGTVPSDKGKAKKVAKPAPKAAGPVSKDEVAVSGSGDQLEDARKKTAPTRKRGAADKRPNIFVRMWRRVTGIGLFVRQVIAELKKVVYPTRTELTTYTTVVLVFVLVVMAFIGVLDLGFGYGATWLFTGSFSS